jgi:hypothetical protein
MILLSTEQVLKKSYIPARQSAGSASEGYQCYSEHTQDEERD